MVCYLKDEAPEPIPALEDCGYDHDVWLQLRMKLRKRTGLIVFTGPPNSGKTISRLACVQHVASAHRKAISLEREVTGEIEWATRLPIGVDADIPVTALIKSALLAEPDVLVLPDITADGVLKPTLRAALATPPRSGAPG